MRFCVIHVHDEPGGPEEEAIVIVPGAGKVAVAVPLDALPGFLPILHEATEGLEEHCCPSCRAPIRGARGA